MNSLKTIVMVGIMAAVAYGVYVSINEGPVETPPEIAEDWSAGPPEVSLPTVGETGTSGFSAEAPTRFPSPGDPPLQARSGELSPRKPFSKRAPAPPFNPAPLPSDVAVAQDVPMPPRGSEIPAYPAYAPPSPAIGSNANLAPDPTGAPLPDSSSGSMAPMPPASSVPTANQAGVYGGAPGQTNGSATPNPTEIRPEFADFLAATRRDLGEGRFRDTLAILSTRYGGQGQTEAEAAALIELLDQVAGTVIYSRQHHLEPAYVVQAGETLPQIAEKYGVPHELLAKINRIADPMKLQPGQELKVVRGPFRAVVKLDQHEMDLWLQDLYAGRFAIGVGSDLPEWSETLLVMEKNREPTYYGPTGQVINPGDPLNPLGKRRIGLGDSFAIHGTNDEGSIGQTGGPGCIRLGERDADDVYDILSLGSRVVIQR